MIPSLITLFAAFIFAAQSPDFSYKARELRSGLWINSSPVTLKSLRGKVVVIGVHTPRADYEKDVSKLRETITRLGIKFPVVVDEKQKMFRDYLCDLWPSQFVIGRDGIVRYSHGGVGRYDEMEKVVQNLLKAR